MINYQIYEGFMNTFLMELLALLGIIVLASASIAIVWEFGSQIFKGKK